MKKNKTMIFLFILPTVLCLLFMYVYPVVRTVIMSFFKVESLTASTSTWSFYGLQNYFKILRNAGFISSIKNMVMIWLVGGVTTMCLSMLMAVILTSGIRGAKFFKAAIYMPNIISAVALATMWIQYVFNYDYGLLNQIVKAFGGENVRWLGTDLIFWAMMIAFIFGSVGYYMLIFISGIEGIPQDLYEAATIDGANIFDRFFQITLPLLKGVIRTCVTFWSINATTFFLWTKMFSPINTETATIVPVVYLYDTVFGGKGVGLMNMIMYAILAVFICGLMVGRTPEYLGKKIEGREMKLTALCIIIHPFLILAFSALAVATDAGRAGITNPGFHGLSQVLYEYASSAANNGSGFEGLADNSYFWNITAGLAMFFGRYLSIVIQLAIAGSLMKKRFVNESAGTLRTSTFSFAVILVFVVYIFAALTFFPALALGPIAEHLTLWG